MTADIDSLFFDLDGTLVDSLPGIEYSVRWAAGSDIPSLRALIGPPIQSILRRIRPRATQPELDALTLRFRTAYDSSGWRQTTLQEGSVEVLAALRKSGKRLFLVTNKPAGATAKILGMLGIRRHFVDVLARNSRQPAFESKPEMLRALLDRYRLDANRSLMVGDTLEDYTAATAAGMHAVIVANGYGAQSDIPLDNRLQNLNGLLSLLYGAGTRSYGVARCVNASDTTTYLPAAGVNSHDRS